MTFTAADFRHVSLRNVGLRPLLIAVLMYSLGFVGAGVLVWRGVSGLPNARRPEQLFIANMGASDVRESPLRAGDP